MLLPILPIKYCNYRIFICYTHQNHFAYVHISYYVFLIYKSNCVHGLSTCTFVFNLMMIAFEGSSFIRYIISYVIRSFIY